MDGKSLTEMKAKVYADAITLNVLIEANSDRRLLVEFIIRYLADSIPLIIALDERITELEAALKPFAEYVSDAQSKAFHRWMTDQGIDPKDWHVVINRADQEVDPRTPLTFADFLQAVEVFEKKESGE